MKSDKIAGMFSVVIVVFVISLAANAWFQADSYRGMLENKAVLAAFVKKNSTASIDVIKERIINTDNVYSADLVTSELAMKNAIESTPALGEILITKENPFSPYFLVKANKVDKESFEPLKEQLSKMEGIDAVVYDKNNVEIHDALNAFASFYKVCLKSAGIAAVILLLLKLVLKFRQKDTDPMTLAYAAAAGLLSGIAGTGIASYAAHKYVHSAILSLPSGYFGYFMVAGIVAALLWE